MEVEGPGKEVLSSPGVEHLVSTAHGPLHPNVAVNCSGLKQEHNFNCSYHKLYHWRCTMHILNYNSVTHFKFHDHLKTRSMTFPLTMSFIFSPQCAFLSTFPVQFLDLLLFCTKVFSPSKFFIPVSARGHQYCK